MMDALTKMYMQFPGYTIFLLFTAGVAVVVCAWLFLKLVSAGDLGPKDETQADRLDHLPLGERKRTRCLRTKRHQQQGKDE